MLWKHRLNLRDTVIQYKGKSDEELAGVLPVLLSEVSERLEQASVFRASKFPKSFRAVSNVAQYHSLMEELLEFADENKVWLGIDQ
jgi:hypothetical protein